VVLSWPIAVAFLPVLQVCMQVAIFVLYALKDVVHALTLLLVSHAQLVSIYSIINA